MSKSVQLRFSKSDKRLLGVWKSDKRRTFTEWDWGKNTPLKKRNKLKSFFGKQEVTYTRNKIHIKLPHRKFEYARHYSVLGMDETSVAIVQYGEIEIKNSHKYWCEGLKIIKEFYSKPKIQHIHFVKNHLWISIGNGKNREFFRKIRDDKQP